MMVGRPWEGRNISKWMDIQYGSDTLPKWKNTKTSYTYGCSIMRCASCMDVDRYFKVMGSSDQPLFECHPFYRERGGGSTCT